MLQVTAVPCRRKAYSRPCGQRGTTSPTFFGSGRQPGRGFCNSLRRRKDYRSSRHSSCVDRISTGSEVKPLPVLRLRPIPSPWAYSRAEPPAGRSRLSLRDSLLTTAKRSNGSSRCSVTHERTVRVRFYTKEPGLRDVVSGRFSEAHLPIPMRRSTALRRLQPERCFRCSASMTRCSYCSMRNSAFSWAMPADRLIQLEGSEPSTRHSYSYPRVELRSIYCARAPARRNCLTESGPVVWYRAVTFPTRFPSRNVTATRFDTCIPFRTALANGPAS